MIESTEIDTSHWITDRLQLTDVLGGFTALAGNPKVMKRLSTSKRRMGNRARSQDSLRAAR